MTDNAQAAQNEAALNEWRSQRRGWPMTVHGEGEVIIAMEKVIDGRRFLVGTDNRLFEYSPEVVDWIDSGEKLNDPEAVEGDVPAEEPDMAPEEYAETPDVAADDLAEIEAAEKEE